MHVFYIKNKQLKGFKTLICGDQIPLGKPNLPDFSYQDLLYSLSTCTL